MPGLAGNSTLFKLTGRTLPILFFSWLMGFRAAEKSSSLPLYFVICYIKKKCLKLHQKSLFKRHTYWRQLITNISKKTVIIFWPIMRTKTLEHVIAVKICRKRDIGRQCEKILGSLLSWHGTVPANKLMHAVGDCRMWRSMVTHASRQDTWWWKCGVNMADWNYRPTSSLNV